MNTKKSDSVKKSIVLSGLIGTAGLFIAKMLGLFYSIPLSNILGSDAYMSYYGTAYRIYSYILNVFTAGFPFAIATIVAKYSVREDARALRKIKQISLLILGLTGFIGMILMFLLSWVLGGVIADKAGAPVMRTCLQLLSMAIFFVPILSCYRGFWQGRKEMGEYALSQVFEQIFRVGFLLSAAYLIVYVLKWDTKYALYVAVMSTSIAAIAGILQIVHFDKKNYVEIEEAAKVQKTRTVKKKKLFKELLALAIPYFLVAVLGYCDDIFNSVMLPLGVKLHGYSSKEVDIIISAFNYVGTKMTAIPMILSPGFAAALIPHITSARTEGDIEKVKKNVVDCVNIIFYVGLPVSFCIFLYASDIYHTLFFTQDPSLASNCLRWLALEGFLATITPVVTNLLMALGLKKDALKNLLINVLVKGITMIPLIWAFGYGGAVLSTIPGNIYIVLASFKAMNENYDVTFKTVLKVFAQSLAGMAAMLAVCYGLRFVGLSGTAGSKLVCLLKMCVNGMAVVITYAAVTSVLHTPEFVFHTSLVAAVKNKLHRNKKEEVAD